ncbi:MAG: Ig-like domain repeat protein [Burkholderiales bacterium]
MNLDLRIVSSRIARSRWGRAGVAAVLGVLAAVAALPAAGQANVSRLLNLLDATPAGGWVQVNTNRFSDAWVTGPDALPSGSYSDPAGIVHAWSGFAWDPNRGNLLLWGGGHANYMGNEMYVWQGSTGQWTRGSLSSRLVQYNGGSTFYTVDSAAPQSAHTYDNNLFLPVADMFITFGGAAFNSGGVFVVPGPTGAPVRAGPWVWDPRKADPNKVGGTSGSGYNTATAGGQMWINQQGKWAGAEPPSYVEGTAAYRQENGRDVVYVTGDSNASGWPSLYRYEPGDPRAGATGTFQKVAIAWNVPGYQATGTIDTKNQLYVRTSNVSNFPSGLGVWDLTKINAANPSSVTDRLAQLVLPDGSLFTTSVDYAIDFDEARGKFVLWDGHDGGNVYEATAVVDAARNIGSQWPVVKVASQTASHPVGNYMTGVLGKFHYVAQLGAFVVLDEFQSSTGDAAVWLYKPVGWQRPGGTAGNTPPTVSVTAPAAGATYAAPATISIAANAGDSDGTIARVDFYAGTTLIGTAKAAPYTATWSNVAAGAYALTAVATDNGGASTTSATVNVVVDAVTLTSSANPATLGATVTLTASVTGSAPTGTVSIADAGSPVPGCTALALAGTGNTRTASCATANLAAGVHSLVATYSGDAANRSVTSAPLSQTISPSGSGIDTIWLDDVVPAGGVQSSDDRNVWNTSWSWASTPAPKSGTVAHRSLGTIGIRQHYFYNATATLAVATGDALFAYVYLDPTAPPKQLLLQWYDGDWEHRAYWGTNLIGWGVEGTVTLRNMGPLPPTGQWVKLIVPASQLGLEGHTLSGLAFAHYDGVAVWDSAGKTGAAPAANVPPTVSLISPASNANAVAPGSFTLTASAADSDGTIARVDFYAGSTLLGSATAAPFSIAWSGVAAGAYTLTAVAVDNKGASTTSAPVNVAVNAIALASTPNPSVSGAVVTLTATVTGRAPTGTVAFRDAGSAISGCSAVPLAGGANVQSVTCSTAGLAVGTHALTAVYSGDPINRSVTSGALSQVVAPAAQPGDTFWVDDAVPVGAFVSTDGSRSWNTSWTWVSSPTPKLGALAHRSLGTVGIRQHYFYNATTPMTVATGGKLFTYVYIDPANPPAQLLLQWNDGDWEHRAYWGANMIGWGVDGTNTLRYMGSLPTAGQWVRLEVPASLLGLEGHAINGMAFAHYGGVVYWDAAGTAP